MKEDDDRRRSLVSAARTTSQGMADAVVGRPDDCTVNMRGSQFRVIATLLGRLADEAERGDSCDCMGRPVDGFRFWVPQDRFTLERNRADRLADEVAQLRETLRFAGDLVAY